MAQNLFPDGYTTEVSTVADTAKKTPVGFRSGLLFDYQTGDFPQDGRHRIIDSTGIESWKSWVVNCMATERYKYPAYSRSFGLELDKIFSASSRSEAESILTRQITEALAADPYQRTAYIESLSFNWSASGSVEVFMVLHGLGDAVLSIATKITQGGT